MQKIVPFLWFNDQAESAAQFYVSIFPKSQIQGVSRMDDARTGTKGTVMVVRFQLDGQDFMALNGGPQFTFSPAISMLVNCETQDEIDTLWRKLSEGGEPQQCGWLKDRYGLSWQIVPTVLGRLMEGGDPARSRRVMQALQQMTKLEIGPLERAYEQA